MKHISVPVAPLVCPCMESEEPSQAAGTHTGSEDTQDIQGPSFNEFLGNTSDLMSSISIETAENTGLDTVGKEETNQIM